jgi:phage FluMu gp28-like protein
VALSKVEHASTLTGPALGVKFSCMVGVIVRRDEDEFARWIKRHEGATAANLEKRGLDPRELLKTEVGFLAALARLDGEQLEFDNFQLRFLACRQRFRSLLKARQIGYSFVMAAEMLARSHLNQRYTAICVSFNLDDAKEKVSLIKLLHDELPLGYQKRLCIDSKTVVGFESRDSKRKVAVIQSLPSKAPRGKSGDCYIDEFAFCLNDRAIYTGASSLTIRSKGQLTIGSTPFGQRGKFYELHEGKAEGSAMYWRMDIPWWLCKQFCRDVPGAAKFAPTLPTAERVARFGTRDLLDVFGANTEDDFKQEYELEFQDERVAYFNAQIVLACCHKDAGEKDDRDTIKTFETIEELAAAADDLGPLYAGFDVGRTKHPSELWVLEERGNGFVERFQKGWTDLPFQAQFRILDHLLEQIPQIRAFRGDATGMGKQLLEDLRKKHGPKVEEWTFTNQIKADLAANLKILFEGRLLELVKTRSILNQLGSIRQKITEVGNVTFDVAKGGGGKDNKHHGDKVWALALAAWRKRKKKWAPQDVGVRVIGAPSPKRDSKEAPEVPSAPRKREPTDFAKLGDVGESIQPRRPEFAPDRAAAAVLEGHGTPDMYPNVSTPVLERRARMIRLSLTAWERAGNQADAASGRAELRGLLGELKDRNVVFEF